MRVQTINSIDEVSPGAWNGLVGSHQPFLRYEFLAAMEHHDCVGDQTGWWPRHMLVFEDSRLVGAVPQYLKDNSYGEFVFDWAWADAYARAGLAYYPKLVTAVPFTPVTGLRLLAAPDVGTEPLMAACAEHATAYAAARELSSVHWLFTTDPQTRALEHNGWLRRTGCQYHWHNAGYRDFDDFLDALTSKRRKQIRRERRDVNDAGIRIEIRHGGEVTETQWEVFHAFYRSTFDRKWGAATLTPGFFKAIGESLGEAVVLLLAVREGRYVAGSLCLRDDEALYGRHWGCNEFHRSLHFEMCYYSTIQYCIDAGLGRFDAGAQGEHKISRGFVPGPTWSAHWVRHEGFRNAVARFVSEERHEVERYMGRASLGLPYRSTLPCPGRCSPASE